MSNWRYTLLWASNPLLSSEFNSVKVSGYQNTLDLLRKAQGDGNFISKCIRCIEVLPEKYKEKVYASAMQYEDASRTLLLSFIGISDVGSYWDRSDLSDLTELLKPFGLGFTYSPSYKYVILGNLKNE